MKWTDLIVPEQRTQFEEHWHDITTKGHAKNLEYTLMHKDGYRIDVILNASSRFGRDGTIVNTRGSVLNITARKHAEQARHRLLKELEAKHKELESVLYAASHDLKSPLVNIQGFGHELSRSCDVIRSALSGEKMDADLEKAVEVALNEDIPGALDFILTSARKMDSLLSGLLDICRLNTAAVKIEPIHMDEMMAGVVASIGYQIEQTGVKLDIEPLPNCLGDVSQINRVFTNLLTNALKFLPESRPGHIRIHGRNEGNQSVYCIQDNGIGIAPEHLEKIFEIFYQLEPEKRQGEGIGLAIVRRIVDRHNGRVWAESRPGAGSEFFVALPAA
jgi:signal transduction histidine kinase